MTLHLKQCLENHVEGIPARSIAKNLEAKRKCGSV